MKRKGFWISAGLLIVPVVIFYILGSGVQNFRKLPILGNRTAPDGINQKDTLYYKIPDFHVWDQTGKEISQATFKDKIYVANFFFAGCKTICPTINRRLYNVYDKYKEFTEVQFISFTIDPQNDSIPVLYEYAKKYKVDANIWHFVTGLKDSIFKIGQGLLMPVSEDDHTVDLSKEFVLVDKENRIRGVYDSFSEADVLKLEDDLKVLLYEYHQPGL